MSIYVGICRIGLTIVYCKVGVNALGLASSFKLCPLARQIFILKGEKVLLNNFHIMIPKFPSVLFILYLFSQLAIPIKIKNIFSFKFIDFNDVLKPLS